MLSWIAEVLHRSPRHLDGQPYGWVPFAHLCPFRHKPGVRLVPSLAIPAAAEFVQSHAEALRVALDDNAYIGLNSSRRPARPHEHYHRGELWDEFAPGADGALRALAMAHGWGPFGRFPLAWHRNDSVAVLNACWVDLDCLHPGDPDVRPMKPGEAMGHVVDMYAEGIIPPPSLFLHSGGGLWCFWLLIDENNPPEGEQVRDRLVYRPDTAPRATPERIQLWNHIMREGFYQVAGFRRLGLDPKSKNPGRWGPMPGTARPKYDGYRVTGLAPLTPSPGALWAYTLPQLAYWFNIRTTELGGAAPGLPACQGASFTGTPVVETPERKRLRARQAADTYELRPPEPKPAKPATFRTDEQRAIDRANGAKGRRVYWAHVWSDLLSLVRARGGGFCKGHIHHGLRYLALAGIGMGKPAAEVLAELRRVRDACEEHYDRPLEGLVRDARAKQWRIGYATIRADLFITDTELAQYCPYMHRRLCPPPSRQPRMTPAERRAALSQIRAQRGGVIPSTYEMADLFGVDPSRISHDYKALGWAVPLGRRRKDGAQLPLVQ